MNDWGEQSSTEIFFWARKSHAGCCCFKVIPCEAPQISELGLQNNYFMIRLFVLTFYIMIPKYIQEHQWCCGSAVMTLKWSWTCLTLISTARSQKWVSAIAALLRNMHNTQNNILYHLTHSSYSISLTILTCQCLSLESWRAQIAVLWTNCTSYATIRHSFYTWQLLHLPTSGSKQDFVITCTKVEANPVINASITLRWL